MTVKEAFKIGFATELAARGITPDQFSTMIIKRANWATDIGGGLANALGSGLKALAIGVPATAALGGYMAAGANKTSDDDLKAIEDMSIINEYQDAISQIKPVHPVQKRKRVKLPMIKQPLTAEERTPEFQTTNQALPQPSELSKVAKFIYNISELKKKPSSELTPMERGFLVADHARATGKFISKTDAEKFHTDRDAELAKTKKVAGIIDQRIAQAKQKMSGGVPAVGPIPPQQSLPASIVSSPDGTRNPGQVPAPKPIKI